MLDLLAFKATDVPAKNHNIDGSLIELVGYARPLGNSRMDLIAGDVYFVRRKIELVEGETNSAFGRVSLNVGNGVYYEVGGGNSDGGLLYSNHKATESYEDGRLFAYGSVTDLDNGRISNLSELVIINLTKTFGKGNEPTAETMNKVIESLDNNFFDGTINLFDAKRVISAYSEEMKDIRNAITALGGSI